MTLNVYRITTRYSGAQIRDNLPVNVHVPYVQMCKSNYLKMYLTTTIQQVCMLINIRF